MSFKDESRNAIPTLSLDTKLEYAIDDSGAVVRPSATDLYFPVNFPSVLISKGFFAEEDADGVGVITSMGMTSSSSLATSSASEFASSSSPSSLSHDEWRIEGEGISV